MPRVDAPMTGRLRRAGNGAESSAVPADPDAALFAGVPGIRVCVPSIDPSRRSPTRRSRDEDGRKDPLFYL